MKTITPTSVNRVEENETKKTNITKADIQVFSMLCTEEVCFLHKQQIAAMRATDVNYLRLFVCGQKVLYSKTEVPQSGGDQM